jgi:hypothetical protein
MEKDKLTGVYFKKQFDPPLSVGDVNETIEEIAVFPCFDGFIDFRLIEGQENTLITISYKGYEWHGTMEGLVQNLKDL